MGVDSDPVLHEVQFTLAEVGSKEILMPANASSSSVLFFDPIGMCIGMGSESECFLWWGKDRELEVQRDLPGTPRWLL